MGNLWPYKVVRLNFLKFTIKYVYQLLEPRRGAFLHVDSAPLDQLAHLQRDQCADPREALGGHLRVREQHAVALVHVELQQTTEQ